MSFIYGLDHLASVDGSGTRTWEIHDALGSVRQHLAADGSVVPGGNYAYTPFGVVASGNTPAPFGFTGELHSEGLVYLRARWYDPSSGAFTARDPFAGFPETPYSLHPYQYAYAAPTMWTDPSGECVGWIWGDPSCAFIGQERIQAGDLNYEDATPWAGAGLDVAPITGDVKGFIEVFTGCDLITGEDLGGWRYLGLIPIAGPRLRKLKLLRLAADVTWLNRYGDGVGKLTSEVPHFFSIGERGEELASPELLEAVQRKGRQIFQDEDTQMLLDYFSANASNNRTLEGFESISLRLDPRKIEVLEEFLHGTQRRLGIPDRMDDNVNAYERHVKDFMIRYHWLLGISENDVEWLKKSMEMYPIE